MLVVWLSFWLQFGEKSASDDWQQLLKNESDPGVQRVVAYDHSITWAEENTSQNLFVALFQIVSWNGKFCLHLPTCLLLQNFTETSLTARK